MIEEILTASGVLYRRSRFLRIPEKTFAVYFDDRTAEGADAVPSTAVLPRTYTHDVRVELYELKPDDAAEAAIEAQLDARGLTWTKQDRYWLSDLQRYQVMYEFSYTDKRRN